MDWPRLHAALNDLPAALLLAAVVFDIVGAIVRRDSLRAAGYWSLIAGFAGALLAIGSGLMAEDVVTHDDAAHALMERHELVAFIVLGWFGALLLWRLVRRTMRRGETVAYLVAGTFGVVMLVGGARIGGMLVFDHGVGVPAAQRQEAGAAGAPADSTDDDHEHAPGTPAHDH